MYPLCAAKDTTNSGPAAACGLAAHEIDTVLEDAAQLGQRLLGIVGQIGRLGPRHPVASLDDPDRVRRAVRERGRYAGSDSTERAVGRDRGFPGRGLLLPQLGVGDEALV